MKRVKRVGALGVFALALASVTSSVGAASVSLHAQVVLPKPPVFVSELVVHIRTTSDWTNVTFSEGRAVVTRLRGRSGPGDWIAQNNAIDLEPGSDHGTKRVTVDLLYVDTSNAAITIKVAKGQLGSTRVAISNPQAGIHLPPLIDVKRHSDRNMYTVAATYSKPALVGHRPARLPRVDPRRLVLAFYYPWYSTYRNWGIAQRPADPRSTLTRTGVNAMTRQAKANGVDGFIVSWAGAPADGKGFNLALTAARKQHQKISGYLETVAATRGHLLDGERRELTWLVQLLQYRHSHAFLKTQTGIPVVFVYTMNKLSSFQWQDLLRRLHKTYHLRVALVGDDTDPAYLPFEYGLHEYGATAAPSGLRNYSLSTSMLAKGHAALYPGSAKKLFAMPVSPGYDDQKLHGAEHPVIPRAGGRRYLQSWKAALAGQPDWILVTSWNEWFEDTAIEPGAKTGARALELTKQEAAAWKSGRRR